MNSTKKRINKFKAIELIKTFSSLEMKRFGRFLQSPYHNNNKDLIAFFDFLRPLYPSFDQAKLNRQKIWNALFKSSPFQAIKFKKLFSELNKLAEEFLIIEQIKSDKSIQQRQLIAALKPRHFKRFVKASQNSIKEIEAKNEYQSQDDFLDLHLLYQDLWYHIEWEKHQVNQRELMKGQEALVTYMAFSNIRTISEIETRKKFLNLKEFVYPATLNFIADKKLIPNNISYALVYGLLQFEQQPSWEAYLTLKKQIFDNFSFLNQELLQDGIIHLNNYLTSEIGLGKLGLEKELFELLKWGADNRIFINNDRISETIFSNTVVYALKNRQITWAENYLKNNERYLKTANKNLIIGHLKASMAYTKKKFKTVIALLITLQPSHQIQYYFFFKSVITRSYFELILQGKWEYLDSLHDELAAFEKGVRRNRKFAKSRKESYLNYIKIMRQLSALLFVQENRDTKINNLKTKIKTLSPLDKKKWLMEKIYFF